MILKAFLLLCIFGTTQSASALGVRQIIGKIISFDKKSVQLSIENNEVISVPRNYFNKELHERMLIKITLNDEEMALVKKITKRLSNL